MCMQPGIQSPRLTHYFDRYVSGTMAPHFRCQVRGAPASTTAPAVAPAAMLPRTTRHAGAPVSTTYLGLLAVTEGVARALSAQRRRYSGDIDFEQREMLVMLRVICQSQLFGNDKYSPDILAKAEALLLLLIRPRDFGRGSVNCFLCSSKVFKRSKC